LNTNKEKALLELQGIENYIKSEIEKAKETIQASMDEQKGRFEENWKAFKKEVSNVYNLGGSIEKEAQQETTKVTKDVYLQ